MPTGRRARADSDRPFGSASGGPSSTIGSPGPTSSSALRRGRRAPMSTRSASHEISPSCGATTTPRTSPLAVVIRTRWPRALAGSPVRELRNREQPVARPRHVTAMPTWSACAKSARCDRRSCPSPSRSSCPSTSVLDLGADRLGLAAHDRLHGVLVARGTGGEEELARRRDRPQKATGSRSPEPTPATCHSR